MVGSGKKFKSCGIANNFAKICRKTKVPLKPKPWVINVDENSSEAATIGASAMEEEQVNQIETMM